MSIVIYTICKSLGVELSYPRWLLNIFFTFCSITKLANVSIYFLWQHTTLPHFTHRPMIKYVKDNAKFTISLWYPLCRTQL